MRGAADIERQEPKASLRGMLTPKVSTNEAGWSTLHIAMNLKRPVLSWDTENRIKRTESPIHFDSHWYSTGLSTDMLPFLLWVLASQCHIDTTSIFHVTLFSPPLPSSAFLSLCFLPLLTHAFLLSLPQLVSMSLVWLCLCVPVVGEAFVLNFPSMLSLMQQSLSEIPCQYHPQADRGTCQHFLYQTFKWIE